MLISRLFRKLPKSIIYNSLGLNRNSICSFSTHNNKNNDFIGTIGGIAFPVFTFYSCYKLFNYIDMSYWLNVTCSYSLTTISVIYLAKYFEK